MLFKYVIVSILMSRGIKKGLNAKKLYNETEKEIRE